MATVTWTPAGFDPLEAIASHSAGLASSARGNLAAAVRDCPGWSVADLVAHVTEVHWFWATIVEERLSAPPAEERRPARAVDAELVERFEAGADRLVTVLGAADPSAAVWTWAPAQHDVAFVLRHQVQEVAVHHYDASLAAGAPVTIEAPLAADAVDEFLTFSLSTDADPADPPRPALDGAFVLACSDHEACWTLHDGSAPGTVAHERGARQGLPALRAPAADLLLWLYGRHDVGHGEVPEALLGRFSALSFTD